MSVGCLQWWWYAWSQWRVSDVWRWGWEYWRSWRLLSNSWRGLRGVTWLYVQCNAYYYYYTVGDTKYVNQNQQLIEKVLHAGLRFFTHSWSCNLLYALFIFKQVRHTYCLSLHVYVHCIACNFMFLYVPRWLSSKAWASNPPGRWHKLTYLVLTCRKTPINQSINPDIILGGRQRDYGNNYTEFVEDYFMIHHKSISRYHRLKRLTSLGVKWSNKLGLGVRFFV